MVYIVVKLFAGGNEQVPETGLAVVFICFNYGLSASTCHFGGLSMWYSFFRWPLCVPYNFVSINLLAVICSAR
jgi:hypothetical protein